MKIKLSEKDFIVKSFKVPNLINRVVYRFFRKSKAERSYYYAQKLLDLEINTPQPIAFIEKTSLVALNQSYYISQFVDYSLTYRDLIENKSIDKDHSILKAFTKFTFYLHEKGIKFLDHSPGNTLILKNKSGYDFYLVDLNRMQFGPLNFDQRMQNFARLTPDKAMVEIMSAEYARLGQLDKDIVFERMWFYTERFFKKTYRKRKLKKRFLKSS